MSTAYAATSQAWAARHPQQANHPNHFALNNETRQAPLPALPKDAQLSPNATAKAAWRAPVTLFVKLEFGLSFGDRNRAVPHGKTFTIGYPPENTTARTPRFLFPDAAHGRRATSEQPRGVRQKEETLEIPLPITQQFPPQLQQAHTAPLPQLPFVDSYQQQQRHGFYQQDQQRAASALVLPSAPTCYAATRAARQHSNSQPRPLPVHAHTYGYTAVAPPRRQLTREFLEGKSLPNIPTAYRLGESEMPWESPIGPILDTNQGGRDVAPLTPHSADAATPRAGSWYAHSQHAASHQNLPSQQQQGRGRGDSRGSNSTPTTPIISPQSTVAVLANPISSGRVLTWDANNKQWIASGPPINPNFVSPENISARLVAGSTLHSRSLGNSRGQVASIDQVSRPGTMHNNEPAPSLPALDFETTQERHEREERERRALATDPQRAEDLSVLSAAMVAVDVLDDRFFVAEPRPSMEADEGALKRRSLGWAVRVEPVGSENVVGAGSARRARNESVASTVSAVSPDNAGGEQRERRQYLTAGEQTGGHDPEYWRAVQRRRSWTTGDQRLETGIVMYR